MAPNLSITSFESHCYILIIYSYIIFPNSFLWYLKIILTDSTKTKILVMIEFAKKTIDSLGSFEQVLPLSTFAKVDL